MSVVQAILPDDLAASLAKEVERSQFSVSAILRLALRRYLTHIERHHAVEALIEKELA